MTTAIPTDDLAAFTPTRAKKRLADMRENLRLVEERGFPSAILWPYAKWPEGISRDYRRRIEEALCLPAGWIDEFASPLPSSLGLAAGTPDQRLMAGDPDQRLAANLTAAIGQASKACCGFLYLKAWTLRDGTSWYKVGVTNDPARRDNEQNVLPTSAVTLKLVRLPSMVLTT